MKLIYVASPYAGDIERNTEFAKEACRFVMDEGHAFFAPHLLYPQVLDEDDPAGRELGLAMGRTVLEWCDEVWVFGDTISSGMQAEIELAQDLELPVKHICVQEMAERERPFAERHPFCSMRI
jgi:hypothetical protein